MNFEIDALKSNQTWFIINLPIGKTLIGCKWIYKLKFSANGGVEQHKMNFFAKVYTQLEGVDHFNTYSPVAKMNTVHFLKAVVAAKNWFLDQFNVNNAFLHSDLNEEDYMTLPQGLCIKKPNQVYHLNKSLYNLK